MSRKTKRPADSMWKLFFDRSKSAEGLQGESDRAVSLITAAFLDDALELLLRKCLIDRAKITDELFGSDRPLGSFSARVKMAYCLGHISRRTFEDLEVIRSIRNDFAHSRESITFATPSIRDRCMNLSVPLVTPGEDCPDFTLPRVRYIESTAWINNLIQAREREIHRPTWPANRP